MSRGRKRSWLIIILIVISVYSCIETFFPELPNKAGFLVIDALVTDEARSYDVYLTRSVTALNSKITYVKGATVSISDTAGMQYVLQEITPGHYITDSKKFTGNIGNKYILHIKTGSDEYVSDTCKMYGTSVINKLYFGKSTRYTENGVAELTGLSLYLDGEISDKRNCYLRWDFNEVWKFIAQYPPLFSFTAPDSFTPLPVSNRYCWKSAKSTDVLIQSFQDQDNGIVKNKEIAFFLTNLSDRFNQRYSILVNQYTISQKEYEFWNMLRSTNEEGGGIFERQPYSISGNIKNLRNPDEVVMGYFQVSSVCSKRLYIDPLDVASLKLPLMISSCDTKVYQIGDMGDSEPFKSLKAVYDYIVSHDSVLVMPHWNDNGVLVGMIATSKDCSDCSRTGDPKKPPFWSDITFR